MKKATIVDDAITYISKLQQTVDILQDELLGTESVEVPEPQKEETQVMPQKKRRNSGFRFN